MRVYVITFACLFSVGQVWSQKIDKLVKQKEAETHLKYLASDALMGRDTGSPEIDTAAQYITDLFEKYGVKKLPDRDTYYQEVPLLQTNIPSSGTLEMMDSTFTHGQNILILRGADTTATLPALFAGYALEEDLDSLDVKGKLVIARFGFPGMTQTREGFAKSREKRKSLTDKGALGIIELYNSRQITWPVLMLYLNRSSMVIDDHASSDGAVPYHMFINDSDDSYSKKLEGANVKKVSLDVKDLSPIPIKGKNIIGYIEGSDKNLKNEYVILSAHYDHVGHTKASFKDGEPQDSIFNGARDNALGTTGILLAAKYFGSVKPKRSILFIGFTAEEKGLLGSEYYAEHPWAPLEKCVFNLNIDCAGYNDTTKTTIFGLGRNTAKNHLVSANKKYGLEAIDDPVPEQNIFERSDHFNFAKKGIPAVLYGPGLTSFDEEIQKYYHQLIDHAETLNFSYLMKVYKAFIEGAEGIANDENPPLWTAGDKFEEASKKLYGK